MLRMLLLLLAVAGMAIARVGVCAEGTIVQVQTDALKLGGRHTYLTKLYVQSGDNLFLCRTEETAEPNYKEGDRFSFPEQQCEGEEKVTFVKKIGVPPDYAGIIVQRVGGTQWRCPIPDGAHQAVNEMEEGEEMPMFASYFGNGCLPEPPPKPELQK